MRLQRSCEPEGGGVTRLGIGPSPGDDSPAIQGSADNSLLEFEPRQARWKPGGVFPGRGRRFFRFLGWAGLLAAGPSIAADAPPSGEPDGTPRREVLTLDESVRRALELNLDLKAERLTPRIAEEEVRMEEALFDPEFEVSGTRTFQQRSTAASRLEGADRPRTDSLVSQALVRKLIGTGATISLESRLARTGTNSADALLNPAYDTEVSANVRQPLLRGRGPAATAERDRSRIGRHLAQIEFSASVMDVVLATEIAYFSLAFAIDQLELRRFSLDLAESFLDEVEFRREAGAADALDVLRAEVSLADRREMLVEAEQEVMDRQDDLLNLIGQFETSAEFDLELETTPLDDPPAVLPDVEDALLTMRERRPEFLFAVEQIEQFEVDKRLARNQRLPSLDVGAGVGYTGLDRSPRGAFDDLTDREGHFWRAEVVFSMPWGLREDRARYRRAELFLDREISRLVRLKQDLLVETRTNLRAISSTSDRVDLARRFTDAGRRQYEMEEERFREGVSTTRDVLDAQAEFEEARLREIDARIALHEAAARLRRTTGESLVPYEADVPDEYEHLWR